MQKILRFEKQNKMKSNADAAWIKTQDDTCKDEVQDKIAQKKETMDEQSQQRLAASLVDYVSQPHFGQVWGWSPTLPKLGIWSPPGLPNV